MRSPSFARIRDAAGAFAIHRVLRERESWSRDRLLAFQHAKLRDLVAYASRHSPFYRERFGGEIAPHEVELTRLPPTDRAVITAHFDDVLTRRDVTLEALEAHLASLSHGTGARADALLHDGLRVMTSGGSSGKRGVFVYDRAAWRVALAGVLRWTDMMGLRPRLPRRRRVAAIGAPDAKHMTFRMAVGMDFGLHDVVRVAATEPLDAIVRALSAHQPEFMNSYPTVLAMLAEEQLRGRLSLRPEGLCTSSELRTPEMTARIREAFGVTPFDCLGMTETGITAVDCREHAGLHVFEDLCVYEVVDEANHAVPSGTPGARVLVTNLFNRTLPLIRYEITDLVTLDARPCSCGSPFARLTALEGRSDDILVLPGLTRETVSLHPIHVRGVMSATPEVLEYQIVQRGRRIEASVRLRENGEPSLPETLRAALEARLREHGAAAEVVVDVVAHLAREGGAAKQKLVRRVT